jgi:uncharacterized membrane protein YqjE
MAPGDRSFSDVVQDIIRNVQEIVRAEVRLAKTEFLEEAAKTRSSLLWLGAGTVAAIFALFFLLLMIVDALTLVLPRWGAALIVGAVLALTAGVMVTAGLRQFKQIHPAPERTVETIKENIEWARQQTK